MVADRQDSDAILSDAIQKMKWKFLEIHSAYITLADCIPFRRIDGFVNIRP